MVVTRNLLGYSDVDHDGETALLYAISKQSGYELGRIGVLVRSRYGMSSWVHDGYQYLMLQTGAKLTAVALPAAAPGSVAHKLSLRGQIPTNELCPLKICVTRSD